LPEFRCQNEHVIDFSAIFVTAADAYTNFYLARSLIRVMVGFSTDTTRTSGGTRPLNCPENCTLGFPRWRQRAVIADIASCDKVGLQMVESRPQEAFGAAELIEINEIRPINDIAIRSRALAFV
jgi:hypothetical protein